MSKKYIKFGETYFANIGYIESNDYYIFIFDVKNSYPKDDDDFEKTVKLTEDFYKKCYNEKKIFASIFNYKKMGVIDRKYVFKSLESFNSLKFIMKKYLISTSIVLDNMIVRGVLNLFLSMYEAVRPIIMVENEKKALAEIEKNSFDFFNKDLSK